MWKKVDRPLVRECHQKNIVCVKNKVDWPLVKERYEKNIACVKNKDDRPLVGDRHQIILLFLKRTVSNFFYEIFLLSTQNMF